MKISSEPYDLDSPDAVSGVRPHAAGARPVEVDEVDVGGARLGEGAREVDRVAGPGDDLVVGTLVESDRPLAEHVDGRDHLDRRLQPLFQHAPMLTC